VGGGSCLAALPAGADELTTILGQTEPRAFWPASFANEIEVEGDFLATPISGGGHLAAPRTTHWDLRETSPLSRWTALYGGTFARHVQF
jgi:hypothetical protein